MAAPRRSITSDEKIAQALQEEFDLEAEQHSAAIPDVAHQLQAVRSLSVESSASAKISRESRVLTSSSKRVSPRDGGVQRGSASSSTLLSPPKKFKSTSLMAEKDRQLALEFSEDYPHVEKELARRIHDLDSIPHIPKVNGAIPVVEAANEDHQRLLDRLSLYGLAERRVAGDGNCQFRALSDQLYRSPEHHMFVRDKIFFQLTKSADSYSEYVPMKYDEYLRKMAKDGEWGDHVTLQAAADYYGVKICLITSFKDTCFVEVMPTVRKSTRELYLSFWAEVHYNSLYPLQELPEALRN